MQNSAVNRQGNCIARWPRLSTIEFRYNSEIVHLEILRTQYRPSQISILFVGEAPPASGRFFYRADSGLYRAFRSAFVTAFPSLESSEFLEDFKAMGCYLIDLCESPVDQLSGGARRRICAESEGRLATQIRNLQPGIVVIVVRSIAGNVRRSLKSAGWGGETVELPYPGRWRHHQRAFQEVLVPLLRRELPAPESSLGFRHLIQ